MTKKLIPSIIFVAIVFAIFSFLLAPQNMPAYASTDLATEYNDGWHEITNKSYKVKNSVMHDVAVYSDNNPIVNITSYNDSQSRTQAYTSGTSLSTLGSGKNLFDLEYFKSRVNGTVAGEGEDTMITFNYIHTSIFRAEQLDPTKSYILSYMIRKHDINGYSIYSQVNYADGESTQSVPYNNGTSLSVVTLPIKPKAISSIFISYTEWQPNKHGSYDIKYLQLEEGTSRTAYEPYCPTLTSQETSIPAIKDGYIVANNANKDSNARVFVREINFNYSYHYNITSLYVPMRFIDGTYPNFSRSGFFVDDRTGLITKDYRIDILNGTDIVYSVLKTFNFGESNSGYANYPVGEPYFYVKFGNINHLYVQGEEVSSDGVPFVPLPNNNLNALHIKFENNKKFDNLKIRVNDIGNSLSYENSDLLSITYGLWISTSIPIVNELNNNSTLIVENQTVVIETVFRDYSESIIYKNGVNDGYKKGYNQRENEGFSNALKSWKGLLPTIIGSTASFFIILLDIQVFGTTLMELLVGISGMVFIFFIVKLIKGGG